jgi:hypothetical protein
MADTSSQSSGDHVQVVDIDGQVDLVKLHADVIKRNARVELIRRTSNGTSGNGASDLDARCVLISKCELDGLERALEILAATDDVRSMRQELARIIARSGEPLPAVFGPQSGPGIFSSRVRS